MDQGIKYNKKTNLSISQVIASLVCSLFALPSLQWGPEHELDHLELFAGQCAVTRGEFEDGNGTSVVLPIAMILSSKHSSGSHVPTHGVSTCVLDRDVWNFLPNRSTPNLFDKMHSGCL